MRAWLRVLVAAASAGAISCGGGSNSGPTSPSASVPQFQTLNFTYAILGPGFYLQDVGNTPVNVNFTATATWSSAFKDIDLYWTNTLCNVNQSTGAIVGTGCQIFAQSTAASGTSETVRGQLPQGQTARFLIFNLSNSSEQVNLRVDGSQ